MTAHVTTNKNDSNSSTPSSRTDHVNLLDTQLAEWKAEFASLREQAKKIADKVTGEASHDVHATLDALKEREQNVEKKIRELKAASDDAWDTMKVGFEVAWIDLKGASKEALAKLTQLAEKHPAALAPSPREAAATYPR